MKQTNIRNNQLTGLVIGIILILLSCCGSIFPLLFSLDMMSIGFALQCFSLFFFLMGLITFLIYLQRYFRLRSILKGKGLLVHWQYDKAEYISEVEKDRDERRNQNLITLGIVWFFFITITGLFVLIAFMEGEQDSLPLFLGIMGGVLLIVNLAAFLMPELIYLSSLRSSSDVLIARKGMYHMGQLHIWNNALSFIENVEISADKKQLIFTLRYFTKLGWFKYESYEVRVPIPKGQYKEARNVVNELGYSA
ncbi:MAG TPA: hypothetical protein PKU95_03310 [Candidatus Dojkabacteria bacterium]|nr:hypothetical protein [Candidatus Dojkabacteria bacterium]